MKRNPIWTEREKSIARWFLVAGFILGILTGIDLAMLLLVIKAILHA